MSWSLVPSSCWRVAKSTCRLHPYRFAGASAIGSRIRLPFPSRCINGFDMVWLEYERRATSWSCFEKNHCSTTMQVVRIDRTLAYKSTGSNCQTSFNSFNAQVACEVLDLRKCRNVMLRHSSFFLAPSMREQQSESLHQFNKSFRWVPISNDLEIWNVLVVSLCTWRTKQIGAMEHRWSSSQSFASGGARPWNNEASWLQLGGKVYRDIGRWGSFNIPQLINKSWVFIEFD